MAALRGEPLLKRWMRGLEFCREHASNVLGREATLKGAPPPVKARGTRWALVGRIAGFDTLMTYTELHRMFERWDDDERIAYAIGAYRLARITALCDGIETRGSIRRVTREYTIAEISPWEVMVSRARERTDPTIEHSFASLYDHDEHRTLVKALYVWIALEEATPIEFAPD